MDRKMHETTRESTFVSGKVVPALIAALLASAGCGGASNSEVKPDAASGSGGSAAGTGGTTGGTGGTVGGGSGGTVGGGGTGGTVVGGSGGSSGGDANGGSCPARTAFTLGVHIVMDATWAATTATQMGTGKIHLWNRAKFDATGTMLKGETANCGTVLPEFALNALGSFIARGSKVSISVPDSVWDAPTIPKFPNGGMLSGWDPGSTLNIEHTVALVGLTMTDPMVAWPKSYTGLAMMGNVTVDADGDGKPGFTAVPKDGNGYITPPTDFLGIQTADKVYLASRTIVGLSGKIDSCTEQSGTAAVTFFDSHVVGCHVKGAGDCTAAQTDFVDQSRTDYKVTTGVFNSKQVKDDATCADVRAALPM
jgi:hypothetical protein